MQAMRLNRSAVPCSSAQCYPASALGLYFKGGLGIGRNAVDFEWTVSESVTLVFRGSSEPGTESAWAGALYLNPAVDLVGRRRTAEGAATTAVDWSISGSGVLVQMGG